MLRQGVKIRSGASVLSGACRAHPPNRQTARIFILHHRLGPVPVPQSRYLDTLQLVEWQIGHIDIEYEGIRQRVLAQTPHEDLSDTGCGLKVPPFERTE